MSTHERLSSDTKKYVVVAAVPVGRKGSSATLLKPDATC